MVTWIYDEVGSAAAILDEFCLRSLDGVPQAWVFGVSVFSIKGDHIGWFEHGVLFDVDNNRLGFVQSALGMGGKSPPLQPAPPVPGFPKRPCVPALRARLARPHGGGGWSVFPVADYLEQGDVLGLRAAGLAPRSAPARPPSMDISH